MFLAYLIFTEFEILIMYCCCRPRLTSLFPKKALNKWIFRWKIHKDSSPFFCYFFSLFSPQSFCLSWLFFRLFFIFLWGGGGRWVGWRSEGKGDSGTPWVVSTSGLLPDILQQEMNNLGGGGGRQFIIILLYIYQKRILHPDQNVTFKLWFWHLQSHEGQF